MAVCRPHRVCCGDETLSTGWVHFQTVRLDMSLARRTTGKADISSTTHTNMYETTTRKRPQRLTRKFWLHRLACAITRSVIFHLSRPSFVLAICIESSREPLKALLPHRLHFSAPWPHSVIIVDPSDRVSSSCDCFSHSSWRQYFSFAWSRDTYLEPITYAPT